MRFLDRTVLPDLIALQREVAAALPDPEIFMLHGEAYFSGIFDLPRAATGVFSGDRLIGYCFILIPGSSPANLGRDINLPEKELCKVAHIQAAAVHPDFRGRGLQKKMLEAELMVIEDLGYRHVCCTVSPGNPVSLKNVLSCGLVISALRPKLHGWCRYIMHKEIAAASAIAKSAIAQKAAAQKETEPFKGIAAVGISDLRAQADLLKRGLVGYGIERSSPGGYQILFAII